MEITYWETAKNYLTANDKLLGSVIKQYNGEMLASRSDAFFTLARSIVGQQISVKAADSVWKRFVAVLPSISPHHVREADFELLRGCGLSASKVSYLHSLADYFLNNSRIAKDWEKMNDGELEKSLTSISGIGRWTAEMFMIFYLTRPDVFPIADIGLKKAMFRLYNAGKEMPNSELQKIATQWRPYRTVATWYLWRSLDPVPVEY